MKRMAEKSTTIVGVFLVGWCFFFCLETENLFSGRGLALFPVQWRDVTVSTPQQAVVCSEAKLLTICPTVLKCWWRVEQRTVGMSTALGCKGRQRECLNLWGDGVVCESGPLASSWFHAVKCLTTHRLSCCCYVVFVALLFVFFLSKTVTGNKEIVTLHFTRGDGDPSAERFSVPGSQGQSVQRPTECSDCWIIPTRCISRTLMQKWWSLNTLASVCYWTVSCSIVLTGLDTSQDIQVALPLFWRLIARLLVKTTIFLASQGR